MAAFNPALHVIDPVSGFQLDKETGHIAGLMAKPVVDSKKEPTEYPKWIEPDPSHIVRKGDYLSTPMFPMFHVDRDGKVTVMVNDEKEEKVALSKMVLPNESEKLPSKDESEDLVKKTFTLPKAPK